MVIQAARRINVKTKHVCVANVILVRVNVIRRMKNARQNNVQKGNVLNMFVRKEKNVPKVHAKMMKSVSVYVILLVRGIRFAQEGLV